MTAPAARLAVRDLTKRFDGVTVLRAVNIDLHAGRIHAVLGQNGSGKSTLVKILTGFHRADGGSVAVDGVALEHGDLADRISVIHQDLGLADALDVVDNVAVGVRFGGRSLSPIRFRALRREVTTALRTIGAMLDLDTPVGLLSSADRTLVAVGRSQLRTMNTGTSGAIVILDEPTALATTEQAREILAMMRRLAESGAAVMFISHKLAEVRAVADDVTVLRDGEVVRSGASGGLSEAALIEAMLGRGLESYYPGKASDVGVSVLRATGLRGHVVRGIDLELRAGEVLGVTGIGGMGQDEIPALLCGAQRRTGGSVEVGEAARPIASYQDALECGIAYVPSNRRRDGAWVDASAAENVTLPVLRSLRRHARIDTRRELQLATSIIDRTGVVPAVPARVFGTFSGGNQQKLLLGKWLQRSPRVLLLHEPTQGVDVGARRELISLVTQSAERGAAVLVASNDFDQVAQICQRVLVMRDGLIDRELEGGEVNEHAITTIAHRTHSTN